MVYNISLKPFIHLHSSAHIRLCILQLFYLLHFYIFLFSYFPPLSFTLFSMTYIMITLLSLLYTFIPFTFIHLYILQLHILIVLHSFKSFVLSLFSRFCLDFILYAPTLFFTAIFLLRFYILLSTFYFLCSIPSPNVCLCFLSFLLPFPFPLLSYFFHRNNLTSPF